MESDAGGPGDEVPFGDWEVGVETVAVKERPILFSGPMVRAILDGRKTQTRRIVAPNNSTVLGYPHGQLWDYLLWDGAWVDPGPDPFGCSGYQYLHVPAWNPVDGEAPPNGEEVSYRVRPKWMAGEQLWVREAFRKTFDSDDREVMEYRASGTRLIVGESIEHGEHRTTSILPKWRPSIHMPRWASRITLEITDVRVQRLQEISEEDAEAEGVEWNRTPMRFGHTCARSAYAALWNEINGDGSWDANPWVWALTFKVL